jgi:ATP-dependent protease ClpP protease subunit
LLAWAHKQEAGKPGCLVIYFNSSGGNVHDANMMRGVIGEVRRMGHKVVLVLVGRSASCANIVAQGADEVYMDENAWVMTHEVASAASGDKEDLRAEAAFVERLEQQAFRLIANPTWKVDAVQERVRKDRTVWLSAQECWELGLVNGILCEPAIAVRKPQ